MRIDNPYDFRLKKFKGNLHTHCKNDVTSCGDWPLEDVVKIYKERGYDFLSITNHRILTDSSSFNSNDFLLLPGQEIHPEGQLGGKDYHILGIAIKETIDDIPAPQDAFDAVVAQGGLPVFCHPNWSEMEGAHLEMVTGFEVMEVYNGVCERSRQNGLSDSFWDYILTRGRKVRAVAVDDTHAYPEDVGKAWIVVLTDELSQESIISAIRKGSFYASMGPDFEQIEVNGSRLKVKIAGGFDIKFIGAGGKVLKDTVGGMKLEADYEIKGDEKYIRIEVSDRTGKRAWANPLFVS